MDIPTGTAMPSWQLDDRGIRRIWSIAARPRIVAIIENAIITSPLGVHDVAVTNVTSDKTVICQGFTGKITVTVQNQGYFTEKITIKTYANTTIITTTINITLTSGNSTTITFTWDTTGFAKGKYTISAYATPVLGETDTADNTFVDGWVKVVIPGNVNGDEIVDMKDITTILRAYGSTPSHVKWLPSHPRDEWYVNCYANSDVNCDGIVDMKDITIAPRNYGQTEP